MNQDGNRTRGGCHAVFGRWHLILWVLEFTQWASDDLTLIHQIRLGSVSLRVG